MKRFDMMHMGNMHQDMQIREGGRGRFQRRQRHQQVQAPSKVLQLQQTYKSRRSGR